jgi:hypothetical protein
MIQVGVTNILNCKVINNEGKHDEAPFVLPESWGGRCFLVVKFGKVLLEKVVS